MIVFRCAFMKVSWRVMIFAMEAKYFATIHQVVHEQGLLLVRVKYRESYKTYFINQFLKSIGFHAMPTVRAPRV